jgi:hypothetical protein
VDCGLNRWGQFNDRVVTPIPNIREQLNSSMLRKEAYILVYRKETVGAPCVYMFQRCSACSMQDAAPVVALHQKQDPGSDAKKADGEVKESQAQVLQSLPLIPLVTRTFTGSSLRASFAAVTEAAA